jgi:hypothetical protein
LETLLSTYHFVLFQAGNIYRELSNLVAEIGNILVKFKDQVVKGFVDAGKAFLSGDVGGGFKSLGNVVVGGLKAVADILHIGSSSSSLVYEDRKDKFGCVIVHYTTKTCYW